MARSHQSPEPTKPPANPAKPSTSAQSEANGKHVECLTVMSDPLAGVRFAFDYTKHRGKITFIEKPSPEVRGLLKRGGYRRDREEETWAYPIRFASREQDRLHARNVFNQVAAAIREEKGITTAQQSLPD